MTLQRETRDEAIARMEAEGYLDPKCPGCAEAYAARMPYGVVFGPSHKPSRHCESGKRPHCTCDTCF